VTKRNPQAARAEILEKPVTASELLATIRRVLDEKHSHHARAASPSWPANHQQVDARV